MVHNKKNLKKNNEVNKAKCQYCFKPLGNSYVIFCHLLYILAS